MRQLQIFRVTL